MDAMAKVRGLLLDSTATPRTNPYYTPYMLVENDEVLYQDYAVEVLYLSSWS